MPRSELANILLNEQVHIYTLTNLGDFVGYYELTWKPDGDVELDYMGLASHYTGLKLGPWLLNYLVKQVWRQMEPDGFDVSADRESWKQLTPAKRLWLHTCQFDHPKALNTYRQQV